MADNPTTHETSHEAEVTPQDVQALLAVLDTHERVNLLGTLHDLSEATNDFWYHRYGKHSEYVEDDLRGVVYQAAYLLAQTDMTPERIMSIIQAQRADILDWRDRYSGKAE